VSEKFYLDKFSYDAQQDTYRCPAGESLAQVSHKGVEHKGGRGVRELENTELYDDPLYRPEHDRL
jgi:hypothetical protein